MLLEGIEEAVRSGDWQKALELSREFADQFPVSPKAHAYLGLCYMHFADFEHAAQALKRAVALDPHFWQAELVLAQCLDMLGRYEEALHVARQGLKEKPSDPKLLNLVRGLERQVEETDVDGWQRSTRPIMYNIDLTHQEDRRSGTPKPQSEPSPEPAKKPDLKLWVSEPKLTT